MDGTEVGNGGPGLYRYVYSCDLPINLQVKVMSLEGSLGKPSCEELAADASLESCAALLSSEAKAPLFVTAQVLSDSVVVGVAAETAYRPPTRHWAWNEWLRLPATYAELSRDAALLLNIWDYHEDPDKPHCLGGTLIPLFSKRGVFRNGMYDLRLRPFREVGPEEIETDMAKAAASGPMRRLAKLSKKHRSGLIEKVDWLDRLAFREIEVLNEAEKRSSADLFLIVQFPRVHFATEDHAVVYFERNGAETVWHQPNPPVVRYLDPALGLENLVEAKQHQLTRGARSDAVDRELKPNPHARDQLDGILALPSSQALSGEQRDLVWKFRFYLSSKKKALGKFLQSVSWESSAEASQAVWLMGEWAAMDAEDALELLSPEFPSAAVRRYAVARLRVAPAEEILLYLPQLVQALRYEDCKAWLPTPTADKEASPASPPPPDEQDLAGFLISAAVKDFAVANYLFWYLNVESQTKDGGSVVLMFAEVQRRLAKALMQGGAESRRRRALLLRQSELVATLVAVMRRVAKEGGGRKAKIECLKRELENSENAVNLRELEGKIEEVITNIFDPPWIFILDIIHFEACPILWIPQFASNLWLWRKHTYSSIESSLMPAKLIFRTVDGREYPTIFKVGDDMRQDQLIIQMVALIDRILKNQNMDLRLMPYKVIATSQSDGFCQFVDSIPIRDVLHRWNSIIDFFINYRPSSKGPHGVEPLVMENYVRSMAGYSVISYLLGIGDRHLHNLLLCQDGHMFHIDFGFILGRDPKPMPPPMKLTKEMVEGLGGVGGAGWDEFRRLAYTAFIHLRRHAQLLLDLWRLMLDASIPDIAVEPDKALAKIQERFHLDLDDEQAVKLMQHLIDASVSAKMPLISDFIHDLVQTV